jgi:hypothetical protein
MKKKRLKTPPPRLPLKWLAIVPILEGLTPLVVGFALLVHPEQISVGTGASITFLFLSSLFLGLLGLAAGVGIWLGRPWGWWLATYYSLYLALRGLNGVLSSLAAGELGSVLSYGWRLIIGTALAAYLCTEGSLSYFGVIHRKKWTSLLILLAATIGTILAFVVLAALE